ncbi:MAG: GNAT family N-acetyltransferase, partial [Betaproteobacteria bacterium]|nr:GNAT family N-acetyltransferase [Betaproteobacteria bacterium]
MNIRRAHESDFAQWLVLWKGYQTFYKTEIAEDVTAKTWVRFLDATEPMHCAVLEIDGKLAGI